MFLCKIKKFSVVNQDMLSMVLGRNRDGLCLLADDDDDDDDDDDGD
jgi:hypothetical protein